MLLAPQKLHRSFYMSEKTYQTGLDGEETARRFLESKGMIFVQNRYKCMCGEIDLIMLDGETLVFTEVKTRLSGKAGNGLLAVNKKKQDRIARAAVIFMKERNRNRVKARFDVIEVNRDGIIHIKDAFHPGNPV